jgi:hypothetical protein
VSSRDAYLFLDLADETAVVAGRFLKDSAVMLNDLFDYGRLDVEIPRCSLPTLPVLALLSVLSTQCRLCRRAGAAAGTTYLSSSGRRL